MLLDQVKIPIAFRRIHSANLIDWKGVLPSVEFEEQLRAVSAVLSSAPQPEPVEELQNTERGEAKPPRGDEVIARNVATMLSKGVGIDWPPLTDAIANLVHSLLVHSFKYQRELEGDMVYVPPGPFIYGTESQLNLRVANMEKGFWIDRYPATNQQFCKFLIAQGNRNERGVEWLDHEPSRVTNKFAPKPGYENHPVTGMS